MTDCFFFSHTHYTITPPEDVQVADAYPDQERPFAIARPLEDVDAFISPGEKSR